jgi:hypothetical protein
MSHSLIVWYFIHLSLLDQFLKRSFSGQLLSANYTAPLSSLLGLSIFF